MNMVSIMRVLLFYLYKYISYLEYNDDPEDVDEEDNPMEKEKRPVEDSSEDYCNVEMKGTIQKSQEDT